MIIYIYGSTDFKKDIHDVLNHSSVKLRLEEHGEIKDLQTVEELKNAILDDPNHMYLIEDSKILKKNSLNQKIKFLQPKDGIEQEYLLDHGIGDVSVESLDELSKHIIKKLQETIDEEEESTEIQNSIVEIVEDAYESVEEKSYVKLDDELSSLLSHVDDSDDEQGLDFEETIDDDKLLNESLNEFDSLKDLNFDQDLGNIEVAEEKENNLEIKSQGEIMADEFSEFDTLNENDILAALDGLDVGDSTSSNNSNEQNNNKSSNDNNSVNINGSNVDEIAQIISKLLNNKTLEITIKVKE